jgi:hypothetical protein
MTTFPSNCTVSLVKLILVLQALQVLINFWNHRSAVHAEIHCPPTTNAKNNRSGEGFCVPSNDDLATLNTDKDITCPIWDSNPGWVLSGRTLGRNAIVPGLVPDLMIPWKQHNTRAFPRWGRHHYFFRNPLANNNDTTEFIFVPGYKSPIACHELHANLAVNYTDAFTSAFKDHVSRNVALSQPIRTDRAVAIGDPLFLPCTDSTLSSRKAYNTFPQLSLTNDDLEDRGEYCLDMQGIYIDKKDSEDGIDNHNSYGAFAGRHIETGLSITWGTFIPIHRSELQHPLSKQDELLLNYCYTPNRGEYNSLLLLLPVVPGANAFNHADRTKNQEPNVAIMWMQPQFRPERFFTEHTELLFGEEERSSERPPLMVEYVAIREIAAGEEILLDYGDDWQNAWTTHTLLQQMGETSVFRHPIGLPDDMIPFAWLKNETNANGLSYREWLLPKLLPGEVQRMQLSVDENIASGEQTNTQQIEGMVDRIGLPSNMSDFMANWADEMGITEVLRSHVRGKLTLPPEGERRLRLNGTTWWVKRFPFNWRSDMHYITPDDYGSNQMFMHALADAGYDTILDAVGRRDNLTSLTIFYPSYIAVSHCTSALMHHDSKEDGHYNVIFPVVQVNNTKPELIVGDEDNDLYAPYKYETDHAVILGKYGLHGTAPCDYRGTDSMRMVVSVYMVDGDNIPTRNKVIEDWIGSDPPFPRTEDRLNFFKHTKHWQRDDSKRSIRNPLRQSEVPQEQEVDELHQEQDQDELRQIMEEE